MHEEDGINIRELLYVAAKAWRLVIVCALAFGLLFGGYTALKNRRLSFTDVEISSRQTAWLQTNMELASMLKDIEKDKKKLEDGQNYMDKSVLMAINANQKGVATLEVEIQIIGKVLAENGSAQSETRRLIANYLQVRKSDSMYALISNYTKFTSRTIEKEYLYELINISATDKNTLLIEVSHLDAESAEKLATIVLDYLRDYSLTLLQVVQPHNLVQVNAKGSVVADEALAAAQKEKAANIVKLKASIKSGQENVKNLVIADLTEKSQSSVPVRAILGIFLGIFLCCLYQVARFAFGSRLRNAEEIQRKLGIFVIGRIAKV